MNRELIEAAILARLTEKSTHTYEWPRWPAAYEASVAVESLVREDVNERLDAIVEDLKAKIIPDLHAEHEYCNDCSIVYDAIRIVQSYKEDSA